MLKTTLLFAAALALPVLPNASAQTTAPSDAVRFEWGAIHMMGGSSVAVNFAFDDHGAPLSLPLEFTLDDKNGNTVFRTTLTATSGKALTIVLVPAVRSAVPPDPSKIGDLYVPVETGKTITPCIKVAFPPDPSHAVTERMTNTLEWLDTLTGKVLAFANNPHMITGPQAKVEGE